MNRVFLRSMRLVLAAALVLVGFAAVTAQSEISVIHYYSGELGKKDMTTIFNAFDAANPGYKVVDNSAGHEDFKTQILVTIAGSNPPDIFSYWAGARTQFVVDGGRLLDLDQFWADNKLDDLIPASVKSAAIYNGKIYNIPMNVHVDHFFYNPKVMAAAGVTEMPKTWDELKAACEKIKASGAACFALGSKNRWPAQFWFDYLVAHSAGAEFRAKLMAGEAAYTDPEVVKAMELWKELVDAGYFVPDANAYDWTDAADMVANGKAAMNLMGTWVTGYWNGNGLEPVTDYDFFPFPTITEGVTPIVVGTVDGWVVPVEAKNKEGALLLLKHFLSPESQATWAKGQGTLAAVNNVDTSIYSEVMKKASDHLATVSFIPGYDLATTPPMAEGGLNMFAQFMNDPSGYMSYLEEAEAVAKEVFKK